MSAVPMFPLGSVLFPYTPLPLRVFEPRYLTMLGRLLDAEEPTFGVVLIERGHEAGGGDQRSSIGTLARLLEISTGDDDMYALAVGTERITVDRWLDDDPHPQAEVSPVPPLEWNEALTPLLTEAEALVRRMLARSAAIGEAAWDPNVELSDDPVASAWQLAAIAPLGEYDRFTLLQSTTTGGLLRQIIDLTLEIEPLLGLPD
ncbi:LON peptidase substrate-binding domain-containing protein [uncultured Microbacterium sp.]|uniref:Peptidase S16 lon domain protein n=1 Tax=uncultured Microbacterium sp. TaxID=191216 RepID=A0A1Y5P891_9MICO|nr:LON peptidase substrate-binding domain-containing protein [uncultured Microbacterium sp.]SBS74922.1 Peptidase S16 lon domain protein [uncultured Microbacterium sp.]